MTGITIQVAGSLVAGFLATVAFAAEPLAVLDDFGLPEAWHVCPEAWGGKAELAAGVGPAGNIPALWFTGPGIAHRELAVAEAGTRDWAGSAGVSFQVKGDGSALYGSIVVGPAGGSGTAADRAVQGGPATLAAVLVNMQSGRPVRILCAGDSITAGAGVAGGKRYWELLQGQLREEFDNDRITVEGWGISGATMLDALPWVRWMLGSDPPDLVTVMYGTNDCSCYPPEYFRRCLEKFLDRVAIASGGRTAVLPFATLPGKGEYFTKTDPYAKTVPPRPAVLEGVR